MFRKVQKKNFKESLENLVVTVSDIFTENNKEYIIGATQDGKQIKAVMAHLPNTFAHRISFKDNINKTTENGGLILHNCIINSMGTYEVFKNFPVDDMKNIKYGNIKVNPVVNEMEGRRAYTFQKVEYIDNNEIKNIHNVDEIFLEIKNMTDCSFAIRGWHPDKNGNIGFTFPVADNPFDDIFFEKTILFNGVGKMSVEEALNIIGTSLEDADINWSILPIHNYFIRDEIVRKTINKKGHDFSSPFNNGKDTGFRDGFFYHLGNKVEQIFPYNTLTPLNNIIEIGEGVVQKSFTSEKELMQNIGIELPPLPPGL